MYRNPPIVELFIVLDTSGFIIGETKETIANIIYTIIIPSSKPYIIPPNLSNCLITGNFAIREVISFKKINNILISIKEGINSSFDNILNK